MKMNILTFWRCLPTNIHQVCQIIIWFHWKYIKWYLQRNIEVNLRKGFKIKHHSRTNLWRSPTTFLFLDEIHTLVAAGWIEGDIDRANILKPALTWGKPNIIGATTISEYRMYLEKGNNFHLSCWNVMIILMFVRMLLFYQEKNKVYPKVTENDN